MNICKYILIIVLGLVSAIGYADILVQYNFDGEVLTPASAGSYISASDFGTDGTGSATFPAGYNSSDSFSKTGWPSDDALSDYFNFSITVADGFIADVTNLTFYEMRSSTGPTNWITKYSIDSNTWYTLGTGYGSSGDWGSMDTANSAQPEYLSGTVYFRIYATNAASASGTWRLDDVTLYGSVTIDNGTRIIKGRDYDGSHLDNWSATTNLGYASSVELSETRKYSGKYSLRISGSTNNINPSVVFDNVDITSVSNAVLSVAFAADNVDNDDDLWLDVSYDNGASWTGTGSTQLVDGSGNFDLAFGTDTPSERVPAGSNPYSFAIPETENRIMVRIRFQDSLNNNNNNDFYYIDNIKIEGMPEPATNAPSVSNYGGVTGISQSSATVNGLIKGGYPYPELTLFWGFFDGGTNVYNWNYEVNSGATTWGTVSNILSGLQNNTTYYYRWYVKNKYGEGWSGVTSNFTTLSGSINLAHAVYLDSFGVGTDKPLCVDDDADGLSDVWEEEYVGDTSSGANDDSDNDGVSNLREYIAGTNPKDTNSFMRVASLDLQTETSSDIAVNVAGGDFRGSTQFGSVGDKNLRKFTIYSSDSPGNSKTAIATVADTGTGTNIWIDTNMVNETSARYYNVAVSYAGSSYTNSVEWAAYVQKRVEQTDYKYLISVPVDLGASNNLNSTLGQQLARGLYAGTDDTDSDLLYYRQADNTWKQFYLKNVSGKPVWTEVGGSTPADFTVTAGMGFWVVRQGSGARTRTNCVFVGKSFTNAPAQTVYVNNAVDGWRWNVIGWPYATPKHHSATGGADQLGFVSAGGYGGAKGNSNASHDDQGDQIWQYKNNTFLRGKWLMDNIDAVHNGRWALYDSNREIADFELEPGKAYFYRHHVATNGTTTGIQFNWTP